jgi:hypothetical protein
MDDTIAAMMDVARLITHGSDVARAEARRLATKRRCRVDETCQAADYAGLIPISVVAVGSAEQPVERLVTLQSATAKAVHLLTIAAQLPLRFLRTYFPPDRTSQLGHS